MKSPRTFAQSRILTLALVMLGCYGLSAASARAVTYYLAADEGSDTNDGLAPTSDGMGHGPWSSLIHASQFTYNAGATLLLKRGKVWRDQTLTLNGQGTAANPNKLGSYGSGTNPRLLGTSNEPGGSMGIRTSTPDYWTIENIDFDHLWRGIYVTLYTPGHKGLEIKNCNFRTNNAWVLRTPSNDWPTPAATGILIHGFGPNDGSGHVLKGDILDGLRIDKCRFTKMGQSIGINNFDHDGNKGLVRNTLISNCVMENGSFIQLAAVGAHDFIVRNTKIWNNGVNIWNGPANFIFYGGYGDEGETRVPTNLLVEDSEIGFNQVCDSTGCSGSDGEGIEFNGVVDSATFRRVLFHHNDASAVLVNSPTTGVHFEDCVFAANVAYDVNGNGGCEQYGEFRLHKPLTATFSGCRFLPRSGPLPGIPERPEPIPHVFDIPKVTYWNANGNCVSDWHSGPGAERIKYSDTTTSEYGRETRGANLAVGASSTQGSSTRTWHYWFTTPQTFDTVVLTETPGAGIRKFVVRYYDAATKTWRDAYTGKNIGSSIYDRHLRFPARTTTDIQVQILDSNWPWTIGLDGFEVYKTNGTNPTDQFLGTTLNDDDWGWVYGSYDYLWNLFDRPGFLRIATEGHDLYRFGGGVPSILLRPMPAGDWTAITRLELNATANYQQAGLILYNDDHNYIKLVLVHDDGIGGKGVEFAIETNAAFSAPAKKAVSGNSVYLRLQKTGTTYVGSWRYDNGDWQDADHLKFTNITQFTPPTSRVGLIAQSTAGALADFDSFDLQTVGSQAATAPSPTPSPTPTATATATATPTPTATATATATSTPTPTATATATPTATATAAPTPTPTATPTATPPPDPCFPVWTIRCSDCPIWMSCAPPMDPTVSVPVMPAKKWDSSERIILPSLGSPNSSNYFPVSWIISAGEARLFREAISDVEPGIDYWFLSG